MTELLQASTRFPTVVFTIALGIALVYWLFVLLGALDLDLLGGGHHDLDLGGGHEVGGGGDAGGDADAGDVDGGGVWHSLGLGAVPITISVSMIVLVCWCASLLSTTYIAGDSSWIRIILFPLVIIVAFPVASLLVRPLAPVFKIREGKFNADYVGSLCTITTNSVDAGFGFANIEDGHSLVQIAVRCDKPGKLARGDKALIIEFDPERRTFVVEPSADMLSVSPVSKEEIPNG
jgi:hypothetical protein